MSEQLLYRPYSPGDESAILDLFRLSFQRETSRDYWQWRFCDNPTGKVQIELAWEEELLIGHYATSPVSLAIKGREYTTALSMTTMTHPSYRGRGLFPILASRLYERMRQDNYLMVWGFPNYQSHGIFRKSLLWKDIYEIPMFHLNLGDLSTTPNVSECIVEVTEFDIEFDKLWEKVKFEKNVILKRDRKYLNWRYSLNPLHEYRILSYVVNDELMGYAVFKEYDSAIDIVDILTVKEEKIAKQLVLAILDISSRKGIKNGINIWMSVHQSLHLMFEKLGFKNCTPVTYFGARFLSNNETQSEEPSKYSSWYIQMGDSDVY